MGKRPTIQQVADKAGVSRGTVDRVLNNRAHVNAEVREQVVAAIQALGYISPRSAHEQQLSPLLKPLRLGVLLPNMDGFFLSEVGRGIDRAKAELSDFRVEILVEQCHTDVPGEAIERLDHLVNQGCRGLSVCALDDDSIRERIAQLKEHGIPCITFNSDLPGSRRLCFVGQDIRKAGRVAGNLMSMCVSRDSHVLATVGVLKFDGHRQRLDGFLERMKEAGFTQEQIRVEETFNDYATTLRIVSGALAQDPDIRGIYMANLNVTACAEAVRAAGKRGRVRVICHDENEGIRRLLAEGGVDMTIPQDIEQQGYQPLVLLREMLQKGRAPEPDRLASRIAVICAENMQTES